MRKRSRSRIMNRSRTDVVEIVETTTITEDRMKSNLSLNYTTRVVVVVVVSKKGEEARREEEEEEEEEESDDETRVK